MIPLFLLSSEIAKTEFLLREYMKYGFFLLKLSPKHWQTQQVLKKAQMTKSRESMSVTLPVLTSESHILNFNEVNIPNSPIFCFSIYLFFIK